MTMKKVNPGDLIEADLFNNIEIEIEKLSDKIAKMDSGIEVPSLALKCSDVEESRWPKLKCSDKGDISFLAGYSSPAERMRICADGNVGIGTPDPEGKLTVSQDKATYDERDNHLRLQGLTDPTKMLSLGFHTTDNIGWIQSLQYGKEVRPLVLQPNGGNVDIGTTTTSPNGRLQVNGKIISARTADAWNAGFIELVNLTNNKEWLITMRAGDGDKLQVHYNEASRWYGPYLDINPNGNVGIVGNVGIGTLTPASRLEIRGTSNQNAYYVDDGQEDLRVLSSVDRPYDGGIITIGGSRGPTGYIKTMARDDKAGEIVIGNRRSASATRMEPGIVLDTNGNVGIGTTPSGTLHIRGSYDSDSPRANYIYLDDSTNTNLKGYIGLNRNTAAGANKDYLSIEAVKEGVLWIPIVIGADLNNVGIGTTDPENKLDVRGFIQSKGALTDNNSASGFELKASDSGCYWHIGYRGSRSGEQGNITFWYYTQANWIAPLSLTPSGNVGIGTTDPGSWKIYVNGSGYSTGGWHGPGGDYAEYFESADGTAIPVATPVIITNNGMVRAAKKGEVPIGIVTENSAFVGKSYTEWPKKYLRDNYGRLIMEKVEEEKKIPKKEKVTRERQKVKKEKVTEKVVRPEIIKEKGKYIQKEKVEKITREVEVPLFEEVDLYDATGKIIGKHRVPVIETYEEEVDVLDETGSPVLIGSGEFVTVERPKLNPEYDETKKYIPRSERPEWNCIGLLGQIPLRKGEATAPTWKKIKDLNDECELWLVK